MIDLKQIAEKYRNMLNVHKPVSPAVILADAMAEELDTTPLTVEVVEALGVDLKTKISPALFHVGRFELKNEDLSQSAWEIFDNSGTISTVGELRTLARLSGVELK